MVSIHIDDFDKVWIGTFGGGVGLFDGLNLESLDKRDGLISIQFLLVLAIMVINLVWSGIMELLGLNKRQVNKCLHYKRITNFKGKFNFSDNEISR